MEEQEKNQPKKMHGCLVALLVIFTIFAVGASLFYGLYWYVPDGNTEANAMYERGKNCYYSCLILPAADNGWNDYSEAAKKIDLSTLQKKGANNAPQPVYSLSTWVWSGVPPKDKDAFLKFMSINQASIDMAVKGSKKKIIVPSDAPGLQNSPNNWQKMNDSIQKYYDISNFLILCARQKVEEKKYKEASELFLTALGLCRGPEPLGWGGFSRNNLFGFSTDGLSKIIENAGDDKIDFKEIKTRLGQMEAEMPEISQSIDLQVFYYHQMADFALKNSGNSGMPVYMQFLPIKAILDREMRIVDSEYVKFSKLLTLKSYECLKEVEKAEPNKKSMFFSRFCTDETKIKIQHGFANITRIRGLIIAVALREYKKDKGSYPDRLEDLVPAYLPSLPVDCMSPDGKFVYRKKSPSEVILYSFGINLTDEGGSVANQKRNGYGDDLVIFDVKPGKAAP
ncbi:MAG: hypothetical protein LWY06_14115 [Firmicutes bacterium]|nr:hypothetical protein [Bacillota bacterium]